MAAACTEPSPPTCMHLCLYMSGRSSSSVQILQILVASCAEKSLPLSPDGVGDGAWMSASHCNCASVTAQRPGVWAHRQAACAQAQPTYRAQLAKSNNKNKWVCVPLQTS